MSNSEKFLGFSEVRLKNDCFFSFGSDPDKKTLVPIPAICLIEVGKDWRGPFTKVHLANGTIIIQRYRNSYDAYFTFNDMRRSIEDFYDTRGQSQTVCKENS